jgi:hypothetical protein
MNFTSEMPEVGSSASSHTIGVAGQMMSSCGVRDQPRIGASSQADGIKTVRDAKLFLERQRQRARTGTAGEHESAIDIEKKESG